MTSLHCFVDGCFQPASYSAFYDVAACEWHLRAVERHGGASGCEPNPEEPTLCCCWDCLPTWRSLVAAEP